MADGEVDGFKGFQGLQEKMPGALPPTSNPALRLIPITQEYWFVGRWRLLVRLRVLRDSRDSRRGCLGHSPQPLAQPWGSGPKVVTLFDFI